MWQNEFMTFILSILVFSFDSLFALTVSLIDIILGSFKTFTIEVATTLLVVLQIGDLSSFKFFLK